MVLEMPFAPCRLQWGSGVRAGIRGQGLDGAGCTKVVQGLPPWGLAVVASGVRAGGACGARAGTCPPLPAPIAAPFPLLLGRWKAVTPPKTSRPSPSAPCPARRPALPSCCPTGTWRGTVPSGRARRRAARAPRVGAPRRTRRRACQTARRAGRWRTAAAPPRRAWTPRPMRVSWPLPTPRRNAGGGNSWRPQRKVRP